jgi:1-acyl-sn-glycerol-3-phosphate acyltransferase
MSEIIYLAKIICGIQYVIVGQENINGLNNAIILSKHQSAWETIFLAAYFDQAAMIIKQELLYIPFFGWGLALLKPIAIKRQQGKAALQQLLRQGGKFLQQGRWIIVFPEGTRVVPGAVGHYHIGGAKLAVSSGYPIIPVAHNAGSCWQKRQFIKQPGLIKLVFGPAIYPQDHSAAELLAMAKDWIETTMRTLDA